MRWIAAAAVVMALVSGCAIDSEAGSAVGGEEVSGGSEALSLSAPCTDWLAAPNAVKLETSERLLNNMGSAAASSHRTALAAEITGGCTEVPSKDIAEMAAVAYALLGQP